MHNEVIIATVVDHTSLTMEQLAHLCRVEAAWLQRRLNDGLFPHAESVNGVWRFSSHCMARATRMYQFERDFDAVPELAALMADLHEEIDNLRRQLQLRTTP